MNFKSDIEPRRAMAPALLRYVDDAVKGESEYQVRWDSLRSAMFPHLVAGQAKAAIEASDDAEEMIRLNHEVSAANDVATVEAMKDRAKVLLHKQAEGVKPKVEALLDAAEQQLMPWLDDAIRAEEEFFSAHGLSRQTTGVSQRISTLLSQVREFRRQLNTPSHRVHSAPPRHPWKHILDWFTEIPAVQIEHKAIEKKSRLRAFVNSFGNRKPILDTRQ